LGWLFTAFDHRSTDQADR